MGARATERSLAKNPLYAALSEVEPDETEQVRIDVGCVVVVGELRTRVTYVHGDTVRVRPVSGGDTEFQVRRTMLGRAAAQLPHVRVETANGTCR